MAITLPIEVLELRDGGTLQTRVVRWEEGPARIRPARAPQGVEVNVVRIHVPLEDKRTAPPYWDVTATTPAPTLRALLPIAIAERRWLRIVKRGVAPRARFEVDLMPPGFTGPAIAEVVPPG